MTLEGYIATINQRFQLGNSTEHTFRGDLQQLLESLEPREAEVVLGIFQKDQGVKGLDYKFVKEAFPSMLP